MIPVRLVKVKVSGSKTENVEFVGGISSLW